ncbi:MAG: hypothetical protein QNJ51_19160 [Calothrix sp. MO_167.B12]|nr:hypothetical protein [Calothrix sp. MO_167.B12]
MEEQNNQEKQNYEIIPQNKDEIEFLNDNQELDIENLEEIVGGGWGCNAKNIDCPQLTCIGYGEIPKDSFADK